MHSEKYVRVTHQIHAIEQLSVKLRANDLLAVFVTNLEYLSTDTWTLSHALAHIGDSLMNIQVIASVPQNSLSRFSSTC